MKIRAADGLTQRGQQRASRARAFMSQRASQMRASIIAAITGRGVTPTLEVRPRLKVHSTTPAPVPALRSVVVRRAED